MSGVEPDALTEAERRRLDRRVIGRVADLTLPELRRIVITSLLFVVVLALFLWMVRGVIIAGLLGTIIAFYVRPADHWLTARLGGRRHLSALITLTGVILPFVAVMLYSYVELLRVAGYLATHEAEVSRQVVLEAARLPGVEAEDVRGRVEEVVARASGLAEDLPGALTESAGGFSISATIFLFTAFYFLTRGEVIATYLRSQVPPRYGELVRALETSVTGVLYGAIYSTLVVQAVKSAVIFLLNLLLGVPLAAVLAVASFVIGFFPVVGSWSVYLPAAGWLLIFRDDLPGALVMAGVGFFVNTLFLSTYLRPKLAADKSHVLDFYWMLVGLVTGVYTFGLAGVVLGPILIGLLKAILDAVSPRATWKLLEEG